MADPHYRPGDWNFIDQRSGFKLKASETTPDWTGLRVRASQADRRHPQDLVRPVPERQGVPVPRPEASDAFLDPNDVTAESY